MISPPRAPADRRVVLQAAAISSSICVRAGIDVDAIHVDSAACSVRRAITTPSSAPHAKTLSAASEPRKYRRDRRAFMPDSGARLFRSDSRGLPPPCLPAWRPPLRGYTARGWPQQRRATPERSSPLSLDDGRHDDDAPPGARLALAPPDSRRKSGAEKSACGFTRLGALISRCRSFLHYLPPAPGGFHRRAPDL